MSGFASTCSQQIFALILLVASVSAVPVITNKKYVGCMHDKFLGSVRTLGGGWINTDFNTVDQCGAFCKYFKYFGVQYSTYCYCGNKLENNFPLANSQCAMTCAGNTQEKCGNSAINSVYSRTPAAPPSPGTYKGCFEDPWINNLRQLSGYYQAFWGDMQYTPESCASICRGFRYYAMQASTHCFCGNKLNYPLRPVAEWQCNNPCKDGRQRCGGQHRNSMYDRGANFRPFPMTHSQLGCYAWLSGGFYVFQTPHRLRRYDGQYNTMTPYACQLFCEGFAYFGISYGNRCMCSDALVQINKVLPARCNSPCLGEPTKPCGGGGSYVTVYGRPAPTPRPTLKPTLNPTLTPRSWPEAKTNCQTSGGNLATIFNDNQNSAAASACQHAQGCWIGLHTSTTGRFFWINGSPVTYQRFVSGKVPPPQSNLCVAINPRGQWKVARCTIAKPIICVRRPPRPALVAALDAPAPESPKLGWLVTMLSFVLLFALLVVPRLGCARDTKEQVNVVAETNPLLVKW